MPNYEESVGTANSISSVDITERYKTIGYHPLYSPPKPHTHKHLNIMLKGPKMLCLLA